MTIINGHEIDHDRLFDDDHLLREAVAATELFREHPRLTQLSSVALGLDGWSRWSA